MSGRLSQKHREIWEKALAYFVLKNHDAQIVLGFGDD